MQIFNSCPWEEKLSGLYTSFTPLAALQTPFQYPGLAQSRSIDSSGNELDDKDQIQIASLSLIAKNLFKEVVVRQVKGFYQFFQTARDIIDGKRK